MRQCRWMEFLEDYDFTFHYHSGKANVVADALGRKSRGVLASIASQKVSTFYNRADDLHIGQILPVVYSRDSPTTWSTSIHSIG